MEKRFAGSTALITGASRGIGFAIARRLVDEGARVVITARGEEDLQKAAEVLGGESAAIAVAGKADDPDHQDAAVAEALERFGSLDILVNNTGINPVYGDLIDIEERAAKKIFEVNSLAALTWTQKAYRAAMAEHGGSVLMVSSFAALRQPVGIGYYGATKAMNIHMTRQLAMELGPKVRVNAVAPAVVKTRFAEKLVEDGEDAVAQHYPMKRLGEPEDVAAAAAFLLSQEASWITGQCLTLDGGVGLGGPA